MLNDVILLRNIDNTKTYRKFTVLLCPPHTLYVCFRGVSYRRPF